MSIIGLQASANICIESAKKGILRHARSKQFQRITFDN
jgi:hypothetical protein